MNLPNELKMRIDDHIQAVKQHLGELPPDEEREILQALETHIHVALEARSNGTPTPELLETILAELDPPESYSLASPLMATPDRSSLTPARENWIFCYDRDGMFLFCLHLD